MMYRVLAGLLLFLVSAGAAGAQGVADAEETIGPRGLVLEGDPVRVVLPPDRIPSIDRPELVSAEEADRMYRAAEPVLGVVVDGEARAYSLWHLDRHEIVNDRIGGRAIAATW